MINDLREKPVGEILELEAILELKALARDIHAHDKAYHQNDAPVITDGEYDQLRKRNDALEAKYPNLVRRDSPSNKVGAPIAAGFSKITHNRPMLSLGNAFSAEDVRDYYGRIRRFLSLSDDTPVAMVAEPKIDGLSINVRYKNGRFVRKSVV